MKYVLILDNEGNCWDCPCCRQETGMLGDIVRSMCQVTGKENLVYCDGYGMPKWCPLKHPLKYASNDFYIYDTKYLMENLDREIELLKWVKDYESNISN